MHPPWMQLPFPTFCSCEKECVGGNCLFFKAKKQRLSPFDNRWSPHALPKNEHVYNKPKSALDLVEHEIGFPVSEWPEDAQKAANSMCIGYTRKHHDSGMGRTDFLIFLLHNGVFPQTLVQWLYQDDTRADGDPQRFKHDTWNETVNLLKKIRDSNLPNRQAYNMEARRRELFKVHPNYSKRTTELCEQAIIWGAELLKSKSNTVRKDRLEGASFYYERLFPLKLLMRLFDLPTSPSRLRELSGNGTMMRGRPALSINKGSKFAACLQRCSSLHIGRAYDPNTQEPRLDDSPGVHVCLEVDDLPACVNESHRWLWMHHALDGALFMLNMRGFSRSDIFGHVSGNRSPYLLLLSERAVCMSYKERTELVTSISVPSWNDPAWQHYYKQKLLPFYNNVVVAPVEQGGMGIAVVLKGDEVAKQMTVCQLTVPTYDRAVACDPGHLSRMPFSANEKSGGGIAVPFKLDFSDFPTSLNDIPRLDTPNLDRVLSPRLRVLMDFLSSRAVSNHTTNDESIEPVETAAWYKKEQRVTASKRVTDVFQPDLLKIDKDAASKYVDKIGRALEAASVRSLGTCSICTAIKTVVANSDAEGKDWKERLCLEQKHLKDILQMSSRDGTLQGVAYNTSNNSTGRTYTHYKHHDSVQGTTLLDGGKSQLFQVLAAVTRNAILPPMSYEVDMVACHPSIAWGVVKLHFGEDKAKKLCPCTQTVAEDKGLARITVSHQLGHGNVDAAKRAINACLNQETSDSQKSKSAFLKNLSKERQHCTVAMRAHPFVQDRIDTITELAGDDSVRLFSLCMQTLEAEALRCVGKVFKARSYEVNALLADGIIVRHTAAEIDHCVDAAVDAAKQGILDGIGIQIGLQVARVGAAN